MRIIKLFFLFILIFSCSDSRDASKNFVQIPFDEPLEKLSQIVSGITYIPLKDKAPYFLGNLDKLIVTDDLIIAGDISTRERINVYDTAGNLLSSIRYFGEGPGEFTHISDFSYDPIKKRISVSLVGKVIIYDLDGTFIEEHKTAVLYKGHVLKENGQIVFYLPQYIAPEFTNSEYENGIVFLTDFTKSFTKKLLSNTFGSDVKIPYMKERSVFQFGSNGSLAFSHHFNDTVYIFDKSLDLERKILIDFQRFKMDNSHFENFNNSIDALNNYGNKALNQNVLIYDSEYLGGRIRWKNRTYFYMTQLESKKTWFASKFINDIDGGFNYFFLKAVKDGKMYSVHRSEQLMGLKDKREMTAILPKELEENLFFVIKYDLKK